MNDRELIALLSAKILVEEKTHWNFMSPGAEDGYYAGIVHKAIKILEAVDRDMKKKK